MRRGAPRQAKTKAAEAAATADEHHDDDDMDNNNNAAEKKEEKTPGAKRGRKSVGAEKDVEMSPEKAKKGRKQQTPKKEAKAPLEEKPQPPQPESTCKKICPAQVLSCIVHGRRSIRDFTPQPVEEEKIEKLIDSAVWAPTAENTQQVSYAVITRREEIDRLSQKIRDLLAKGVLGPKGDKYKTNKIFYNAPLVIFMSCKKESHWGKTDAGLAMQNMMLTAHALHLGSTFIGLADALNKDKEELALLGLKEDEEISACVMIGYPNEGLVALHTPKLSLTRKPARFTAYKTGQRDPQFFG